MGASRFAKPGGVFFDTRTDDMDLAAEMTTDAAAIIAEHGSTITHAGTTLSALISRQRTSERAELGGFVVEPELSVRAVTTEFTTAPDVGDRVTIAGTDYRVKTVANHPRSPFTTLTLGPTDE